VLSYVEFVPNFIIFGEMEAINSVEKIDELYRKLALEEVSKIIPNLSKIL